VSAKARDAAAAAAMIDPVEDEIRARLGASVFGVDDETIEEVLARLLVEKRWTIGTAESATGGLVAARLTSLAGSSQYFRGAIVAYAPDLKKGLLGVTHERLVAEETVTEMALGARAALEVDVAVAVVGSAGPEPLEAPVGTMVMAVATPTETRALTRRFPGDRERVRTYSATAALHLVRLALTDSWW
jgi:nicotinamide-nucleotide amidase